MYDLRKKGRIQGILVRGTNELEVYKRLAHSTAKQTEYREGDIEKYVDKDLIVGAKEVPTIKLHCLKGSQGKEGQYENNITKPPLLKALVYFW